MVFEKNFEIEQALSDERFTLAYVSALKTLKEPLRLGCISRKLLCNDTL